MSWTARCALCLLLFLSLFLAGCEPPPPNVTGGSAAIRIVTLAPHLSELVFAAGAGDRLVGVSAFSDYPDAVRVLPVIGDAFAVDQEQLALLAPDLLLAWRSGTPAHVVDELRAAGYRVEVVRTHTLDDIAAAIERIGSLAGSVRAARKAAAEFRNAITQLKQRYSGREPVRVFYQVSQRPLYTINGRHYIAEVLHSCGGTNIFADLAELAPAVTVESVIERDPEVLLAADSDERVPFGDWQRWPALTANRLGNHFVVNWNLISRPTPRVLIVAERICELLDEARDNRDT